ncbi:hypothetical protein XELAEV_18029637mg [Xenopus laevis]|uniref:Alkylated DNA repair protein AlkB homologue 8 N-terminal domain-containing protein n=1 Tax=Xenopus laevis TaxID=8355 RepID=A0A974CRZ5_XENLA|nr:hypothetical protein XELAEV_18029637mg [Xenopus laevis]
MSKVKLRWNLNSSVLISKAQQQLFILRRLKEVNLSKKVLMPFYRGIVESVLTNSIMVWYGNNRSADRSRLQRILKTAVEFIGETLPSIQDVFKKRCASKLTNIVTDQTHPFFDPLPSARSYHSIRVRTARFCSSFIPCAARFLNEICKFYSEIEREKFAHL